MTKLQDANSKYLKLLQENRDVLRQNQKGMEWLTKALGKGVKHITTGDDGKRRGSKDKTLTAAPDSPILLGGGGGG